MSTALVTGATDGIGLHTARKLASSGSLKTLLLHGRDERRLELAKERVQSVGLEGLDVRILKADLADLQQVKDMCAEILESHADAGLKLIDNNAGVFSPDLVYSKDGFELTYQVNVLAPHIITSILHPIVKGKIIHVASISASSSVDLDAYRNSTTSSYSAHRAYGDSKLLNIMQACAYAERLGSDVIVQSLDPGTVNTKMLLAGWGPCGIPVGAADNQFSLAMREGETGAYFVNDRPTRYPSSQCSDEQSLNSLLEMLAEHSGVRFLA